MKLFVCIPTYNEAENIIKVFEEVKKVAYEIQQEHELNLVIIDDNSPDGTAKIVADYFENHKDFAIHIVSNPQKVGLGRAYIKGFKFALDNGADAIFEMDADLSHDPKVLPQMIKKLEEADFVIGSRYIKGGGTVNWDAKRRFISRGGNLYSQFIFMTGIRDLTGGFNGFKRQVLEKVGMDNIKSNGFAFQLEIKYKSLKSGFKFAEIPIIFKEREFGQSKFNGGIFKEAFLTPWRLRFGMI